MKPTKERTKPEAQMLTSHSDGKMTPAHPASIPPARPDRRQPPQKPGGLETPEFPFQNLPGWLCALSLDLAGPYGLPPTSMVLASLTVTGALLGPSLQVVGLEGHPYHPIIDSIIVLPPSPLARRQFARALVPVWAVLDRQARLKGQPRASDSYHPSASEKQFGRTANPQNKWIPRQNPLDRLGPKPGLLALSPSLDHIRQQAGTSIDGHLLSDGTGAGFGNALLELPRKEWSSLMSSLEVTFHRGLFLPEKHPGWLTALWTLDRPDALRVWEKMNRGGRRPPPFVLLDAGTGDAKLSPVGLSQKAQYAEEWHSWCELMLTYRTDSSPLPTRTFSRRARAGLIDLHDKLVGLEKSNPLARAYGVGHFLGVAERIAALLSIVSGEAEIAGEDLVLALQLTRSYLRLHLHALEGLLEHPAASHGLHATRSKQLEESLLERIASSAEGLSIRDLTRSFHRGPDTATIRLTLQKLEVTGAIEWRGNQVVGASAPTDEAQNLSAPPKALHGTDTTDNADSERHFHDFPSDNSRRNKSAPCNEQKENET